MSAGTATTAPDTSREMLVRVSRPATARHGAAATANLSLGGWRAAAVRVAMTQRGKPYRWGSTGPSSFDCSGLVNYAFCAVGKAVPRTSSQLRAWTKPVSRGAAQPGDLVFSPGHVGIYVSPGVMVDASNSGGRVSVRKIYAGGSRPGARGRVYSCQILAGTYGHMHRRPQRTGVAARGDGGASSP